MIKRGAINLWPWLLFALGFAVGYGLDLQWSTLGDLLLRVR